MNKTKRNIYIAIFSFSLIICVLIGIGIYKFNTKITPSNTNNEEDRIIKDKKVIQEIIESENDDDLFTEEEFKEILELKVNIEEESLYNNLTEKQKDLISFTDDIWSNKIDKEDEEYSMKIKDIENIFKNNKSDVFSVEQVPIIKEKLLQIQDIDFSDISNLSKNISKHADTINLIYNSQNREDECKLDSSLPHCKNIDYLPSMTPQFICDRCHKHTGLNSNVTKRFKKSIGISNCLDDGNCCLIKDELSNNSYMGCPLSCFNIYQKDISTITQNENRSILKNIKSNKSTCKDL